MRKTNLLFLIPLLSAFLVFSGCDINGTIADDSGSWEQNEGPAPAGTNLVQNGEFTDVVTGTLDPGDYNNWNNWNVDFSESASGWSSMFKPSGQETGYGDADTGAIISYGPKNYGYIITQDLGTLNAGDYQASMMILTGSGNYEKITLEVIGDLDGALGSYTHKQDNSQVSEATSNDITWQNDNWAREICNVSVSRSQTATLRIKVDVGDGGLNPYTRLDDVFLVLIP